MNPKDCTKLYPESQSPTFTVPNKSPQFQKCTGNTLAIAILSLTITAVLLRSSVLLCSVSQEAVFDREQGLSSGSQQVF